jgi:hypothetical protein
MRATFFLILLSAAACGSGGAGSDAGPDADAESFDLPASYQDLRPVDLRPTFDIAPDGPPSFFGLWSYDSGMNALACAGQDASGAVRAGLVAWYRPRAERQLRERSERWGHRLHVRPRDVIVRDPRQRWGSCDPTGTLRFSWRIIQAPPALVDYVVMHELVHLIPPRPHTSVLGGPGTNDA